MLVIMRTHATRIALGASYLSDLLDCNFQSYKICWKLESNHCFLDHSIDFGQFISDVELFKSAYATIFSTH